ncbi:MAG TPA: exo-alpha-sialidase [Gammaproteobacteria bacterium]
MTAVRVLVGTKKGAFVLTADGKRADWQVSGPHFAGWEIYHVKGSPADPHRIFASQSSGWFGQIIQRSDDGGRTWHTPGSAPEELKDPATGFPRGESNKFVYDTSPETGRPLTTHQYYDGTQRPWEFKRVWHIEPSPTDPDLVYAGVEDAALFRSTDGGRSWHELPGLRGHQSGPQWMPGAGGMCLHTIVLDRQNPERMFTAISAAGSFRTEDGGKTWRPINRGLKSQFIPDPEAEVGHCVHRIAMHPSRPNVLFMQKHWDVMRSDDGGDTWHEVSGDLPSDFGFPIDVHAHEPETIYVVPIKSDSEHYPPEGKLRVYRSRTGGNEWEPLTEGLPQRDCYVNVLRDAMAVDSLDPCGIYFGTTGGQVYASANGGDSWRPIVRDLPSVLSVEVQTLP